MLFTDPTLHLAGQLAALPAASPLGQADTITMDTLATSRVCGVDEAGRGALAGPLVVAAAIPPASWATAPPDGLDDSKQLTAADRDRLYPQLLADCDVAVVVIEPDTIDKVGISMANLTGMAQAATSLAAPATLFDGFRPDRQHGWDGPAGLPLVKGDRRSVAIAAASVVAKVTHDRLMAALDRHHPGWGFATHQGYGTPDHLRRLAEHGPSPIHRETFLPAVEPSAGTLI